MPTVPYVLPLPTPLRGGPLAAWVGAWGIAATAAHVGHEVRVVSPEGTFGLDELLPLFDRQRSFDAPGVSTSIPEPRARRAVKDVRQWAQQRRFAAEAVQAVQALHDVPFVLTRHVLFGGAGSACAAALGVPLVTWIHAPLVQEATSWNNPRVAPEVWETFGEHRYLDRAQHRIAVTQQVLDALDLHGRHDHVLGNGTLLDRFQPGPSRDRRVVWIGTFRAFHGIDRIVRAFRGIDGQLVLVGRGSQRAAIEAEVATRGLGDRVELPGFVPPLQLPDVLMGCKVGVVASGVSLDQFHYSPVKLREYAAAGLVVCLPPVGEMAELADEPWVVTHDNTEASLRAAMREALDRAEDPSVVAAARAYAEAHYGWERWWEQLMGTLHP